MALYVSESKFSISNIVQRNKSYSKDILKLVKKNLCGAPNKFNERKNCCAEPYISILL